MIVVKAVEEDQPDVAEVGGSLNEAVGIDRRICEDPPKIGAVVMVAQQKTIWDLELTDDVAKHPIGGFIATISQITCDDAKCGVTMIRVDGMHNLPKALVRIKTNHQLAGGCNMCVTDVDNFQHLY